MADGYILGLDAGTSVVKAAIFDLQGNELSRGARSVPITNPQPHLAEEDMQEVWVAATEAISHALTNGAVRADQILGVSATGQGDGSWLIDGNGKPAGPAILWTDGRAGDIVDGWNSDGSITRQFDVSGTGPYAGTSSAILRWRQDNQADRLEGATNLWCKDWIEYNLTGDASTDPSDASLSGIDVANRTYSDKVFEAFGINEQTRSVLPKLRRPTEQCGTVTSHAARVTGLREGTPVFKGQMDITASSPVVGWIIPHGPDTWIRALGLSACTPNVDWYLREFGGPFREEAAAQSPEVGLFDFLDAGIKSTPLGSGGVIFHGYLAPGGERAPFIKPSARGMFNGITGSHTRWHLLRAVYEGVAFGIRDCLDSIPFEVETVRMAGGGANSPVWAQIFADVLGRRIVVPAGSESVSYTHLTLPTN